MGGGKIEISIFMGEQPWLVTEEGFFETVEELKKKIIKLETFKLCQ